MRHRVKKKALGRDTKHRKALIKNQLRSLFEHGAIETTETKAKVVRRLADKIITKAKPQNLHARRTLELFFGQRQIVNTIVDQVVPALIDRQSGFTTLTRLGRRRGDDSKMVLLQLTGKPVKAEAKAVKEVKKTKAAKTEATKITKKAATKTSKPTKAKSTAKKSE